MSYSVLHDKMTASFLLGACGDALGAPIEIFKLDTITKKYGEDGLQNLIASENNYGDEKNYPLGQITDDTTMAMTTAAGIILARPDQPQDFTQRLKHYLWQGYLNWGTYQEDDVTIQNMIKKKIDRHIIWPEPVSDFWNAMGAGRGTMACLMQDAPGSIESPLNYDCTIRGKNVKGPNKGCGGMMRVIPVGFLPGWSPERIFELGCKTAALTHGDQDAYVATGVIALYVHMATHDLTMKQILTETHTVLEQYRDHPLYSDGVMHAQNTLYYTAHEAETAPCDMLVMNALPASLDYNNAFLAIPVLAQTTYALYSMGLNDHVERQQIKDTLLLAINHGGDSDSVAAMVGNVMGTRYGCDILPYDWIEQLPQHKEIAQMADIFYNSLSSSPTQKPQPGQRPAPL